MRFWYRLWQCTYGCLQTALGLALFGVLHRRRHFDCHGAVATEWSLSSGLSLGLFVFVPRGTASAWQTGGGGALIRLLFHEYGHTVQSLLLGPLYLPVIGLPSLIWANAPCLRRKRRREGIPYGAFYPERWADRLGAWAAEKEDRPGGWALNENGTGGSQRPEPEEKP